MSAGSIVTDVFSRCIAEIPNMKPMAATYVNILVSALFPIYIGAHASLTRPESAARSLKSEKRRARRELRNKEGADDEDDGSDEDEEEEDGDGDEEGGGDEDDDEKAPRQEALQASDAIFFPVMAGLTLSGLYFLITWMKDPAILNTVLSWYFMFAGLFSAIALVHDACVIVRSFLFPTRFRKHDREWKVFQKQRLCFPLRDDGKTVLSSEEEVQDAGTTASLSSPCPYGLLEKVVSVDTIWNLRHAVYKRLYIRAFVATIFQLKSRLTVVDVFSFAVGVTAVLYFTFVERHWWLTNFLGFAFSYGALRFISPTTFTTASLILMSLFFYDIYFVFFTPLMVTVATKLDIPIKLLFPRPSVKPQDTEVSYAMLGLGDIVIPGMVIGLALRYDIFLFYLKRQIRKHNNDRSVLKQRYMSATGGWGERFWTARGPAKPLPLPLPPTTTTTPNPLDFITAKYFPKTYFYAAVVGYWTGLATTLVAMHVSAHPQPALLYLVPCVLIALWGTALVRGELREMWRFSDAFEDEDVVKKRREKEAKEDEEKKEKLKPRGLFSRLIFGDDVDDDKKKEAEKENQNQKQKQKEKDEKDARKNRAHDADELIGFTISLTPFRPKGKKVRQGDDDEDSSERYDETETGIVDGKNMSFSKRRKMEETSGGWRTVVKDA